MYGTMATGVLTLACTVAGAATCDVRSVGGAPAFVIDGQPHPGLCYSSYDTDPARFGPRVAAFAQAGVDIVNFVVEISGYGYSRPLWTARDRWDFADLDGRARTVLAAAPGAWLLPRIYVDALAWWTAENPGELMVLENGATAFDEKHFALPRPGPYASLASERWRRDMIHALQTVIAHVRDSDYGNRVIGYQLSGQKTEEWYHWSMNCPLLGDYSPPMQAAFRAWLRTRYATDTALQAAWGDAAARLDAAAIPTGSQRRGGVTATFRDPAAERPVVDFHTFWSEIMADTIATFARAVKEATGRRQVVGAFYAYSFEFTDLAEDAGHLAVARLERCPDIDFIMAPSSYFNRNLPGTPYFRAPVESLARHGKLFWNDFDQVSFKYYDKLQAEPALKQWEYQMGLTRTPEEFVWMNRREIGMTLAQGVQTAHFDIHGGYYDDPEVMAGVARLAAIRRRAMASPARASSAQVLVLMDEGSEHVLRFRSPLLTPLLSGQVAELPFVAPYDTGLLADLDVLDLDRYRIILVLNAFQLTDGDRAKLRQTLLRPPRTVVWYHGAGYVGERDTRPEYIGNLTGIAVRTAGEAAAGAAAVTRGPLLPEGAKVDVQPGLRFVVDDPAAEPLAVLADAPQSVVAARRTVAGAVSVYTAALPLPAAVLKPLAAAAGVHIYDADPRHLLFAGPHTLTVGADAAGGPATIRLPRPATVTDLFTGQTVCAGAAEFALQLRPAEVRLFGIE
jgi:hypothetical protein